MASLLRSTWMLALCALALGATACGLLSGVPIPPELAAMTESATFSGDLPAEMQFVMENKADFAESGNGLASVTPGTVKDNLASLTGCWGSYELQDNFPGALPPVAIFEAYHFDAAGRTVQRWVYTSAILMMPPVYALDEGTYTEDSAGRITITVRRYSAYDLSTGEGWTVTDPPDGYFEGQMFITLDGDWLVLAGLADDGATDAPGAAQYYKRFECP
jgi:hypothetical protein